MSKLTIPSLQSWRQGYLMNAYQRAPQVGDLLAQYDLSSSQGDKPQARQARIVQIGPDWFSYRVCVSEIAPLENETFPSEDAVYCLVYESEWGDWLYLERADGGSVTNEI